MIVEMIGTSEQTERFWALRDTITHMYLKSTVGPATFVQDVMEAARFEDMERAISFSRYNLPTYFLNAVRSDYTQIVRTYLKEDISVDE